MRTIKRSTQYKRDYKREKRGRYRPILDNELLAIVLRFMTTKKNCPAIALPSRLFLPNLPSF